ncbi:putative quinol monooxygenase [Holzapfeliella sp. He02]|uniref:Quinol monooxygenase n=1 Tax=Holzapfeliella saturejae TaxID=3082953 RepID=A0ABU8SEY7_9LACO
MIIANVRLTIDPTKREEYLAFIDELVSKSLKDEGNKLYAHFQDTHYENQYLILEHWETQEDLDKHSQTQHLVKFQNHIGDYVTQEPEILFLNK